MGKGCKCFDDAIRRGDIKIHSDNKNLTIGEKMRHTSQRVLRAQTRVDEGCGSGNLHVSGDDNVGGDGLSSLDTKAKQSPEEFFL